MPDSLLLANCRLYDAAPDAPPSDLLVRGGRIAMVAPRGSDAVAGAGASARRLDAGGRTVIPGLIDVHVHGAGGADASDGTPEALATMARALARLGTTSFLSTVIVTRDEGLRRLRVAAEASGRDQGGARLLGVHAEGPFLNPAKRGGLPLEGIHAPTPEAFDAIVDATGDALRMMTIAPEMPGSLDAIRRLAQRGAIAALGHTNASYDEARAGIDAGIRHVTHLFNAMPPLHHREPGPIAAIMERDDVTAELIGDGVHLAPPVVRMAWRALGAERCVCITDAMRVAGLPEGPFVYNGRESVSRGGTARYADGTLIGTTVGLLEVARRVARFTGEPLARVVESATRVPARLLGLGDRKGVIAEGYDADLVVLDGEAEGAWATVVEGRVVHAP